MINKIKFVIFGGVVGLSLFPLVVSALTITTAQQSQVNWFWINATGCSVSSSAPGATLSPSPSCSLDATDFKGMVQPTFAAGTYTFTIYGTNASGYGISASDTLTVTSAAPTTAPSLSISPASGYTDANFTLSWGASNNNPTDYCMNITGPGININDNPACALSQGTARSFTNNLAAFGLGAGTYTFTIYACNTGGCSGNSNSVTYTATNRPPTVNLWFSSLNKVKSSFEKILSGLKNLNIVDKTFAYNSK